MTQFEFEFSFFILIITNFITYLGIYKRALMLIAISKFATNQMQNLTNINNRKKREFYNVRILHGIYEKNLRKELNHLYKFQMSFNVK